MLTSPEFTLFSILLFVESLRISYVNTSYHLTKQGNIYETFPREPTPKNSTTKQGLKLKFETSQKRTLINLAQIMSYLQANHLWPGGESTMILDPDYKYMI